MCFAVPQLTNSIYLSSSAVCAQSEKQDALSTSKLSTQSSDSQSKILSIPMIYGKDDQRQFSSKFHKTLAIKGHKYVSQIVAVGPSTDMNLERIYKSSLKLIRSLDFDAYLCESSGLRPLSKVLGKIRLPIKDFKLIIRRVERLNESDILSPQLQRMKKMKKFQIEFSGEVNVDGKGMRVLSKGLTGCYSLTNIRVQLSYLRHFQGRDCKAMVDVVARLPELRHSDYSVHLFDAVEEENAKPPKVLKFHHLETVAFKSFVKTGWSSMGEASSQFHVRLLKSFRWTINPINFFYVFHNFSISTGVVEELMHTLPHLGNLKKFFLEFSYCKLSELELCVFAGGLKNCTQIRQLTFKYHEARILFVECLCHFIKAIARLDFLERFDLFFRKITCSQTERIKMIDFLSAIDHIEFVLTKASLHVSRKPLES